MKIEETDRGLVFDVYVKPRSRQFKISLEVDDIVIHCLEEPVEGRVNKELLKELSRLFCKKVELLSGFSSKQKRLLVKDAKKSEVENALKNASSS